MVIILCMNVTNGIGRAEADRLFGSMEADNDNPAIASFLRLRGERYPSPYDLIFRRSLAKARSVAMNRVSIGPINFEGSAIGCPVSRASASA